jgi:hypothetical protein
VADSRRSTVRTLSLRQPWAWAVIHAGKRVENRKWNSLKRGPFLLHASLTCARGYYEESVRWMVRSGFVRSPLFGLGVIEQSALRALGVDPTRLPLVPRLEDLLRGGIVASANLVDVLPPAPTGIPRRPWHMAEQFGFVLEDVEELSFQPLRGCLGFFDSESPHLRVTIPEASP